MNNETRQHGNAYLAIAVAIIVLIFLTLLVLYIALKSGDLPILMLGFAVTCAIVAVFWRQVTEGIKTLVVARHIWRGGHYEQNTPGKHGVGSLIIDGYGAPVQQLSIAAPQPAANNSILAARLNDPIRPVAIKLVEATLRDPEYGPGSVKLMSQARAQELNVVTGGAQHNQVTAYLCSNYGCTTQSTNGSLNGTYCRAGASKLLADMAIDQLPGMVR
jgi:hypothetical protein